MSKQYRFTLHREWIVEAPDEMNEDAVYKAAINDFLNVDIAQEVDVELYNAPEPYPDLVLERSGQG